MLTVLVISAAGLAAPAPAFRSAVWTGFSAFGLAILMIGAVLVDMNFGVWSAGWAAGLRFSRMEGGATLGDEDGPAGAPGLDPVEDTSGFNLMVFLAAAEANAELAETGIRFRAAVSVLRIFNELSTLPACILLSVSAIFAILFRKIAFSIHT